MRRSRRRSVLLALALLSAAPSAAFAAPLGPQEAAPAPREPSQEEQASHERMLARLKLIGAETPITNPYLGLRAAEELARRLAEPGGEDPALRRQLGLELLRLGRTEEALENLLAARAALEALPAEQRPDWGRELPLELGLTALRLAENRNCIANHNAESCLFPLRGGGLHVDREGSERAIGWLREARAQAEPGSPAALAARWLLNVAFMSLGGWPDALLPEELVPPEALASSVPFPRFPDVAGAAGVDLLTLAGGAIAEDLDQDGWLDLFVTDWDPRSQARYLHNAGTGTFEDRTEGSGLEGIGGGLNAVQADFDGDGWVDVLILRGAWWGSLGRHPNSLLRNLGGGRFVDVSYQAGVAEPAWPTQAGAWADYDLDGDLDLYLGNESNPREPAPSQLFRNEGDGRFVDVAEAAGVQNGLYAKGVAWGDTDGDRYPELYVSNLGGRNRFYHQDGDGRFQNLAGKLGLLFPRDSFATWFWDPDQDGDLDLYVTSYYQSLQYRLAPVVASTLGLPNEAESARLYRNDGRGAFEDVAAAAGLGRITLPMGANFGDLDGDGYPDLYLGTGYPGYDGLVPNVLYHNRGQGLAFDDVSEAGGFGHLQKGHGVVFADLDNDGDCDLFEELGGAYPGDAARNVLFRNPGFGHHWLRVTLRGTRSARCAIGAHLVLTLAEGEGRRTLHAWLGSGGSFGANPLTPTLGLGAAERILALEVHWPAGGEVQRIEGLPLDAHVEIEEGREGFRLRPEERARLGGE